MRPSANTIAIVFVSAVVLAFSILAVLLYLEYKTVKEDTRPEDVGEQWLYDLLTTSVERLNAVPESPKTPITSVVSINIKEIGRSLNQIRASLLKAGKKFSDDGWIIIFIKEGRKYQIYCQEILKPNEKFEIKCVSLFAK